MTSEHSPAPGPQEIVQLEHGYYILATSALADDRTRVLKSGQTFGVFDRYGDIEPIGLGEQGLYHNGTRHLSRLELLLGRKRPLLLGSRVTSDNVVLVVDLANPDVTTRRHVTLQRDTLHLRRSRFIADGTMWERLSVQNYGHVEAELDLYIRFAADYRDIFEVRGMTRSRRGKLLPADVQPGCVTLGYLGRDEVVRRTTIRSELRPLETTDSQLHFEVKVPPASTTELVLSFACEEQASPVTLATLKTAQQAERERISELGAECCRIESNSERFNSWLDRSQSDLLTMVSRVEHGLYPFAGIPWYSTVFGRDGLIAAMQLLWAFPELARGVLGTLAALQASELDPKHDAEPGKILHEMRGGEMAALGEVPFGQYYGSIDSTPLFVMLAGMYYSRTADLDFIAWLWPHLERAVTWIDQYGDRDGDGFVEYARESGSGLVQQGWKDSHDSVFHADGSDAQPPIALCEVQGYVYAARRQAAKLATALGRPEFAEVQNRRAEALRTSFAKAFWDNELGLYAIALDGDKKPCLVRASNAGHCLFTGIASSAQAARCAKTLLSDEMFSGWGVRTVGSAQARYNPMSYHNGSVWPHDNSLIASGMAQYGFKKEAVRITQALFEASTVVELHRLPELYCGFTRAADDSLIQYPLACAPQAWASGAVFMCLEACIGLRLDALAGRITFHKPALPKFLNELRLHNVRVGKANADFVLRRTREDVSLELLRRQGKVEVIVER